VGVVLDGEQELALVLVTEQGPGQVQVMALELDEALVKEQAREQAQVLALDSE